MSEDGGFSRRRSEAASSGTNRSNADSTMPGKSTRVQQCAGDGVPVQRANAPDKSAPLGGQETVQQAAAQGLSGASGPLPYRDRIQALFGRHDVSGIHAHTDGNAAAGADAMGARAFASGDHVAFGGAPDLHVAAHEAAHVIQQRGGVQLKGGVGEEGDAYERQADAVADRVVAGHDASELLDAFGTKSGRGTGGVQRKSKDKPVANSTMPVTADDQGVLTDTHGERVGFRGPDGKSYVGVDAKGKRGVPLASARLGTIRLGHDLVIESVDAVMLSPVPQVDAVSGGSVPEPQQTAHQFVVTFSGKLLGVTDGDGHQILKHGASWQPIEPSALPPAVAGKLNEQVRIDLDDGSAWVWMAFALRDERTETARWVPPGHSKQEVSDRETAIRAEADKLPSGSDVQAAVQQVIKTISVISTVESGFDGTSQSDDDHASLGIFQWAMTKSSNADAGSLGAFFRTLRGRSDAASAKAEKDRTDEEKLYIRAWKQCTDQGIQVKGKQITLNGSAATGAQVEGAMSDEMGKGSLRTYQLIAAKDWIDEFRATVVRPGPTGASIIGHGYSETASGTSVVVTSGADSIAIDADAPATVGSLFSSEKAVANAIMLGVNRPHYVEAALWRALSPASEPSAEVGARLTALMAAIAATAPPSAAGAKKKPAAHKYTAADVDAAGNEAKRLYGELRAIIWPNRELDAAAQQQLEAEFKKQALKLYSPADARKYHRERRFATVDASW